MSILFISCDVHAIHSNTPHTFHCCVFSHVKWRWKNKWNSRVNYLPVKSNAQDVNKCPSTYCTYLLFISSRVFFHILSKIKYHNLFSKYWMSVEWKKKIKMGINHQIDVLVQYKKHRLCDRSITEESTYRFILATIYIKISKIINTVSVDFFWWEEKIFPISNEVIYR